MSSRAPPASGRQFAWCAVARAQLTTRCLVACAWRSCGMPPAPEQLLGAPVLGRRWQMENHGLRRASRCGARGWLAASMHDCEPGYSPQMQPPTG
eukprot:scaffold12793_cov125-Isochrysis_galbana.AAC.3